MHSRFPLHQVVAGDDRRQRQARREPFADEQDVGRDVFVLDRPHAAGAADAALYFVGDERDAVRVADCAQLRKPTGRRHDVAALTLNGLDEDRGDVFRVV